MIDSIFLKSLLYIQILFDQVAQICNYRVVEEESFLFRAPSGLSKLHIEYLSQAPHQQGKKKCLRASWGTRSWFLIQILLACKMSTFCISFLIKGLSDALIYVVWILCSLLHISFSSVLEKIYIFDCICWIFVFISFPLSFIYYLAVPSSWCWQELELAQNVEFLTTEGSVSFFNMVVQAYEFHTALFLHSLIVKNF